MLANTIYKNGNIHSVYSCALTMQSKLFTIRDNQRNSDNLIHDNILVSC